MLAVESYINHFVDIWEKSSTGFPVFNRLYSETEQKERESNFEQIQMKMKSLQTPSEI